jgi:hypothetical protein
MADGRLIAVALQTALRTAGLLFIPVLLSSALPSEPSVLVVWTSGQPAFQEAFEGLQSALGGPQAMIALDLKSPTADTELDQATLKPRRLIVAIGIGALSAVRKRKFAAPALASMVLRSEAEASLSGLAGQKSGAVYLDVPLNEVLVRLQSAFPGKSRLGVIRNPVRDPKLEPQWLPDARRLGFTLEIRECSSPETLLKTFVALKHKVDFVLLAPDATLYNEATARPLLLASLDNQLPVIGFSASFVRAGSALGLYPEFKTIGEQTGEIARKYLDADGPLTTEPTRKLIFSANSRVLHLMGLDYKATAGYPMVLVK